MDTSNTIFYLTIEIDSKSIRDMSIIPCLSIDRESITEIRLVEERAAKRPIIVLIIGALVMLVGAIPLVGIIMALLDGGGFYIRTLIIPPFMFFVGGLLSYEAFRKRWFLCVKTDKGQSRILLDGKIKPTELAKLVEMAKNQFGYNIKFGYTA